MMIRRRTTRMVTALLAGVMALVLVPVVASAPAGAAPQGFSLEMPEGGGILQIRDAEDPYALEVPTTLEGTVDDETGAISGGTLSTPPVSFETESQGFPVFVDATFSEVSPGPVSGTLGSDGGMVVQDSLTVDLHIEVGEPAFIVADCRTTPVNLTLNSTSPYDPGTQQVTVADADFTIPEIPPGQPECEELVRPSINEQLAGPGHSLTLTLGGELPPITAATSDSVTTLAVSPAGESRLGDPVTMAATVVPAEGVESEADPTGFVEFRDGETVLQTAALGPDGTATLVTSRLPAGTRTLSAVYRGDTEYRRSEAQQTYLVAATPAITSDLPGFVESGAAPTEFDLTVTNTGFGSAVTNGRVDVTIARTEGSSALNPDQVNLEFLDDGATWVPVPFVAPSARTLLGSIGDATGRPLPVGEELTTRLRLSVGEDVATDPGPLRATFELIAVDPTTGEPVAAAAPAPDAVASTSGTTTVVEGRRRATTMTIGNFIAPGINPPVIRQGYAFTVRGIRVDPNAGGVEQTGFYEFFVDGQRVGVRGFDTDLAEGYLPRIPVEIRLPSILTPPDIAPGSHQVTVKYSGDALYLPSQASATITVLPSAGVVYDCQVPLATGTDRRFGANLVAQANLPASRPAGTELDIDGLGLTLLTDRSQAVVSDLQSALGTGPTPVPWRLRDRRRPGRDQLRPRAQRDRSRDRGQPLRHHHEHTGPEQSRPGGRVPRRDRVGDHRRCTG